MNQTIAGRALLAAALMSLVAAPRTSRATTEEELHRQQVNAKVQQHVNEQDAARLQRQQDQARQAATPYDPVAADRFQGDLARSGIDLVLALPTGTEGFKPKVGFILGFGAGDSAGRAELGYLRWSRSAGGQSFDAFKIPIGLFYRGDFGLPLLYWQLGLEGGYEKQELVGALGKGSQTALFWGPVGGAGLSYGFGPVVLTAGWEIHYDWRPMHSSDVTSDAEEAAWGKKHPLYNVFSIALGFRST